MHTSRKLTQRVMAVLVTTLFLTVLSAVALAQTQTLDFTEVPNQPVNGLTVQGVTFGFTIANVASGDAFYNAANGGVGVFHSDPALEGNANGVLTMTFANPTPVVQFAIVRSILGNMAPGATVSLFNAGGGLIQTTAVNLTGTAATFAEGLFSYNAATPVRTVVVSFVNPAAAIRFAIDNLTFFVGPSIGPGAFPLQTDNNLVNDQKAGSVLFYTYYQSSTSAGTNTRVNITNTNPNVSAFVHVFFQAACTPADAYICLTPSQTMSFTTLDFDPDSTGYIVAIAVDGGNAVVAGTGCPINFNWLIGDEYLRIAGGFTANLGAEAVAARYNTTLANGGRIGGCTANATTATLRFDAGFGPNSYDALGGVLAVDSFPSLLDNNAIRLIVQAPTGNFQAGASNTSVLFGVLYDEAEQPFSFTVTVTCQNPLVNFVGTNPGVPRIVGGGLNQVVGIGRTGWMRFWDLNGKALIGAVLINNTASGTNTFTGGHTLHKLTLNTTNVITIPIFTPAC